jgi:putative ABC transport system permease protein
MRGVGPQVLAVRPEIRLLEGRMFRPALHEVIVGRAAQKQFSGLEVGSRIAFRDGDWTVVGSFDGGGSHDSELFTDAETLLSAYRRNQFQSVTALLESSEAFEPFKAALTSNPSLSVEVMRESDYFAAQSKPLSRLLFFVAYVVGGIMAVGALSAALNTMYSAVSARAREIATLRAIGFGAGGIVVSVLCETLLLALTGAIAGVLAASLAFNGNTLSTIAGGGTQIVYSVIITPGLIALGAAWACAIGVVGGLFAALRAARMPVATALRSI